MKKVNLLYIIAQIFAGFYLHASVQNQLLVGLIGLVGKASNQIKEAVLSNPRLMLFSMNARQCSVLNLLPLVCPKGFLAVPQNTDITNYNWLARNDRLHVLLRL